jgi:hypothetical protein
MNLPKDLVLQQGNNIESLSAFIPLRFALFFGLLAPFGFLFIHVLLSGLPVKCT